MECVIVVPTIRGERINNWLKKWQEEFRDARILIVEDNPSRTFRPLGDNVTHYCWKNIDEDLKDKSWIIPRRTAAIRSYGFIKAYELNPEIVITLDDDCYPEDKDFIQLHRKYLLKQYSSCWTQHAQGDLSVRGFPSSLRESKCVLNMGLWANISDLDGETQKQNPDFRVTKQNFNFHLAPRQYAPISSMNVAFKPEIIPSYYYLLMGERWGFDRFDDIWAGIFLKKIADHLGFVLSGGEPYIWHDKASDPDVNIRKEKTGKKVNEFLWKDIDKAKLTAHNFKDSYIELAHQIPVYSTYWEKLKLAMVTWANLF